MVGKDEESYWINEPQQLSAFDLELIINSEFWIDLYELEIWIEFKRKYELYTDKLIIISAPLINY